MKATKQSPSSKTFRRYATFDLVFAVFQTFLLGVSIRRHDIPWAIFNLAFVAFDLYMWWVWHNRYLKALIQEGKNYEGRHHQ